jgi:hypothetical protein
MRSVRIALLRRQAAAICFCDSLRDSDVRAGPSYMETLAVIINEFQLDKPNPKIRARMQYAKMVPWTDSEQQQAQLRRDVGLE